MQQRVTITLCDAAGERSNNFLVTRRRYPTSISLTSNEAPPPPPPLSGEFLLIFFMSTLANLGGDEEGEGDRSTASMEEELRAAAAEMEFTDPRAELTPELEFVRERSFPLPKKTSLTHFDVFSP